MKTKKEILKTLKMKILPYPKNVKYIENIEKIEVDNPIENRFFGWCIHIYRSMGLNIKEQSSINGKVIIDHESKIVSTGDPVRGVMVVNYSTTNFDESV